MRFTYHEDAIGKTVIPHVEHGEELSADEAAALHLGQISWQLRVIDAQLTVIAAKLGIATPGEDGGEEEG